MSFSRVPTILLRAFLAIALVRYSQQQQQQQAVPHHHHHDACESMGERLLKASTSGSLPYLVTIRHGQDADLSHPMVHPYLFDYNDTDRFSLMLASGSFHFEFEQPVLMMKQISAPSVFIDVGANMGLLSNAVASMKQKHTVIAVEPVPAMVTVLCATKRILGEPGYSVIAAAASNVNGNSTFFVPKGRADNTAANQKTALLNVGPLENKQVDVETIRLDDVIARRQIKRVALLKIDTQGHEIFVLRGASESLRSRIIEAVFAENDPGLTASQGVDANDIFKLMTELGWKLYSRTDYVVQGDSFKPRPGATPKIRLAGAGYDVLWLPA